MSTQFTAETLREQNHHWWGLVNEVVAGNLTWDEADREMGEFIKQQAEDNE